MIQFIADLPKGRRYYFSTKEEQDKFEMFWKMGVIAELEPPIKGDPQKSIENYLTKTKNK